MWRMNGLWKGVALALMLCTLQLHHGVMCDEDATDTPAADPGATDAADAAAPDITAAPDAPADDSAATAAADAAGTDTPSDQSADGTVAPNADSRGDNGDTSGTSGTSAAPLAENDDVVNAGATEAAAETRDPLNLVIPAVECVDKEAMEGKDIVTATVTTADCEQTKTIIQSVPAAWCGMDTCRLDISQEGSTVRIASPDAQGEKLAMALGSENLSQLGVTESEYTAPPSGSSVFVAVLLTGLVLAAALIGGYCLKNRRASDSKGIRLAEEACPADEQNQGNTLVSVAPLNPPPETPEKPSVNGESPDEVKTEPPPTNGHSTAKTADTEL